MNKNTDVKGNTDVPSNLRVFLWENEHKSGKQRKSMLKCFYQNFKHLFELSLLAEHLRELINFPT